MKKTTLVLLSFLFFTLVMQAQKQNSKKICSTALEYNDYIVDIITSVDQAWDKTIDAETMKSAVDGNKEFKAITSNAVVLLNNLESFDGEKVFRPAALAYVTHMNSISKKELPAFIKLIHGNTFTPAMEKKAESYLPILDGVREDLFAKAEKAQISFADATGLKIAGKTDRTIKDYEEKTGFEEPVDYNNYISDLVTIIDNYWDLSIDSENKDSAIAYCDTLKMRTEKIMGSLRKLGAFKGYDELNLKAYDYAVHMNSMAMYELREFLHIIHEQLTPDSEKRAESLLPILDDKREKLFELVKQEQKNMSQKYGFIIND